MTNLVAPRGFTQEAFQAFLDTRHEPAWLTELRLESFSQFLSLPLPSTSDEEWRRTDIRLLRLDRYPLPHEATSEPVVQTGLLTAGVELAGQLTNVNSQHAVNTLLPEVQQQGVLFGSLERMAVDHEDLIREHLFRAFPRTADKFAALHAACWSGGSLLYVPAGVKVELPFHLLSQMTEGQSDFGHSLVILEDGAEATLLAETAGGAKNGLHCGGIELLVGPNAKLRYVNLQNWDRGVWHFAHQKALVDRDARLQWTIGALGARLAKVNQHAILSGAGAHVQVNGVMFTEERQHQSYHTLQHHQKPHGTSDLLYKCGLQDHSRIVWRGMIKVDTGAARTNGYQRNDNLILSHDARADSIPGLEIEHDDVICTHGSTTSRVDEEPIFYAQCRGLTRQEATRLIVTGFFQQVFDRITIESVRNALANAIAQRVRQYL